MTEQETESDILSWLKRCPRSYPINDVNTYACMMQPGGRRVVCRCSRAFAYLIVTFALASKSSLHASKTGPTSQIYRDRVSYGPDCGFAQQPELLEVRDSAWMGGGQQAFCVSLCGIARQT